MPLQDTDLLTIERNGVKYKETGVGLKALFSATAVNSILAEFTAAEAIGGHRIITVDGNNRAWLASPATIAGLGSAGMTINAAAANGTVRVRSSGIVEEPGWSWAAGSIYLGPNGTLTQALPIAGAIYQIGVAIGPHRLRFAPALIAQLQ